MAISGASNPTFTQIDNQFKMGLGPIDKELRADAGGTTLYTSNKFGKIRPSNEKLATRLVKQEAGKRFVKDAIDRQFNAPGLGERIFVKLGIHGAVKRSDLAAIRQELSNPSLEIETYRKPSQELLDLAITRPQGATGAALTAFVGREFSSENLNFLRDVHAFKAMPATTLLEIAAINTEARRLAAQYLGDHAETPVNVPHTDARKVDADLARVGSPAYDARTLFDDAEHTIKLMMQSDTMRRFQEQI